jgi:hypothetical protein
MCRSWSGWPTDWPARWAAAGDGAMLSLVARTAVPSGLRPSVTRQQRSSGFPYVAAV